MQKAWLKDIKGMWVATYTEGRMIGVVNNIYIDQETKKVTGLAMRAGTTLGGQEIWVLNGNIKKVGADLIFLNNLEGLSKEVPQGKKLEQLSGMHVSSKDGRMLGALSDVAVNLDNWEMTDLILSNNKTVVIDTIDTVLGKDLILVQSGAEAVEKAKEKKESVVETVFGKDFVKQTSDALKRVLMGSEADLSDKGKVEVKDEVKDEEPMQAEKEAQPADEEQSNPKE